MILENSTTADDKRKLLAAGERYHDSSNGSELDVINSAGSSSERDHLLIDVHPTTGTQVASPTEPPPDFSSYQAEHFEVGYDDIVSHDPHLNSDGEALYRFLLDQSASRPLYRLHCKGTHTETRTRWVSRRDSQGRTRNVSETYNDNITDFDFCIDIVPGDVEIGSAWESHLDGAPVSVGGVRSRGRRAVKPVQWTVPDDEPAYRGKMVREYEVEPYTPVQLPISEQGGAQGWKEGGRRTARRKELKAYNAWRTKRSALGFPPWVRQLDFEHGVVRDPASAPLSEKDTLRSSKTLRQWADEYCASPKYLKEFVYSKVAYGWNMQQIESAVRATIQGTPYNGQLTIEVTPHNTKVYIRPDNALSRMFSNKWLKFLSIILFIFPFVWLYKRFHPNGGGRWEVCGGGYALKQWVPVESDEDALAAATEFSSGTHRDLNSNSNSTPTSPGDGLPSYEDASSSSVSAAGMPQPSGSYRSRRFMQTSSGPKKLVGIKEGEWYKGWEGAIARAVVGRYQSNIPLPRYAWSTIQAQSLDGYNDAPHSPLVQF